MSINQNIRYTNPNANNYDNPESLFDIVKPCRIITQYLNDLPPDEQQGENEWFIIDLDTGNFWNKKNGVWVLTYVFNNGTGGGDINEAINVGGGYEWFQSKLGATLKFRTLITNESLNVTQNLDTIFIETPPYILNIRSAGTGISIFKELVYEDIPETVAEFKSIKAGSNITIVQEFDDIIINSTNSSDITGATNLGTGAGLFAQVNTPNLEFKSIKAGTNISISEDPNEITINATGGGGGGDITGATNIGTGVGVFAQVNGPILEFKKLSSLTTSLLFTQSSSNIYIEPYNDYIYFTMNSFLTSFNTANLTYLMVSGLFNTPFSRSNSHWSIVQEIGVCYMSYLGPVGLTYEMTRYITATLATCLDNQIQELDFILTNGDNLSNVVPNSGARMIFNPYIGGSVLEGFISQSFVFQPQRLIRYVVAFIPRQAKGTTQNITFLSSTITFKQL